MQTEAWFREKGSKVSASQSVAGGRLAAGIHRRISCIQNQNIKCFESNSEAFKFSRIFRGSFSLPTSEKNGFDMHGLRIKENRNQTRIGTNSTKMVIITPVLYYSILYFTTIIILFQPAFLSIVTGFMKVLLSVQSLTRIAWHLFHRIH